MRVAILLLQFLRRHRNMMHTVRIDVMSRAWELVLLSTVRRHRSTSYCRTEHFYCATSLEFYHYKLFSVLRNPGAHQLYQSTVNLIEFAHNDVDEPKAVLCRQVPMSSPCCGGSV